MESKEQLYSGGKKGTEIVKINTTSQTVWLAELEFWGFGFVFPFFVKILSGTAAGHRQLLSLRYSEEEGREEPLKVSA